MPPYQTLPHGATLVYIGTYTGPKSKGIYLFELKAGTRPDSQNIPLVPMGVAAETASPSFLEIDAKRNLLFAVNEVDRFEGKASGAVTSFKIDTNSGKLTQINQRPSMGTGPCHLTLDRPGKNLVVANYGSGSVAVIPVAPDGRLAEPSDVVQHTGSSVDPGRQKGPHAHCARFDPAGRYLFVCDLGLDQILIYDFDSDKGKLSPHNPKFGAVKPGSGPRHIAFRPDGKFAYVINEMASSITAFSYDASKGVLHEVETISSLPPRFQGKNSGAEIEVDASGKFVFASNRGSDSVTSFRIDPAKGTLTYVDEQSSGGKTPRHFGIDPTANYMLICNQNSDNILPCLIDHGTGRLRPSGVLASAPSPVCAAFWKVA